MRFPNLNAAWAHVLVDQLHRVAGVREAIVCPGSRSAPLALACAQHGALRVRSVIDERSAGFVALGMAKQSGAPALVVVTSGTAASHLYPAILEAEHAGVPLIVASADRPWELHGWGAPQTLEQVDLFVAHVRAQLALPVPEARAELFAQLRAEVARVAACSVGARPGPVHLNVPFREPLAPVPDGVALEGLGLDQTVALRISSPVTPDAGLLEAIRAQVASHRKGLIVCGPRDVPGESGEGLAPALAQLSREAGYPIVAEAASQLRFGPSSSLGPPLSAYDAWLRSEPHAKRLQPDLVLRFGGGLTSKRLQRWLDASGAPVVLFTGNGQLHDPAHRARWVVEGSAPQAVAALRGPFERDARWARRLTSLDRAAQESLQHALGQGEGLSEPRVAAEVAAALPAQAQLFVASSMPVRDVDAFAHRAAPLRVLVNRGLNGIDGLVSSALGASLAGGKPTVLLTGDLGLLHDAGGLVSARRLGASLAVVVVNNDGGGIFSFLPVAGTTPHFEPLFGTPHGLTFRSLAEWSGARYRAPTLVSELRRALAEALEGGLWIIEVKTEREANVALHEALGAQVVRDLPEEENP